MRRVTVTTATMIPMTTPTTAPLELPPTRSELTVYSINTCAHNTFQE